MASDDNEYIGNGLSKAQQRSVYNVATQWVDHPAGSSEQKLELLKLAINKSPDADVIRGVIDATPDEVVRSNLPELLAMVNAKKTQADSTHNHLHIPDMDGVSQLLINKQQDAIMDQAHATREPVRCELKRESLL